MPRPKGLPKTGGRTKGVPNKRTKEILVAAANGGCSPVEYMLAVMRDPAAPADRRDRMAATVAPYLHPRLAVSAVSVRELHPRLASIEAKVTAAVIVMTEDERREQARQLIAEAFAERPLKLIEGEVIEPDAAENHESERDDMVESMGRASATEPISLESQDE